MYSLNKTITAAQLIASEVKLDISFEDENGKVVYPDSIIYDNLSGVDVGILYLSSDEESTIRDENSSLYDFIPLESGKSAGELPARVKYIVFYDPTASATGDINIWTLGGSAF